ncbi:MAG: SLC13 family permease [Gammaproteobacteria bacterium]|nr:SLC13 family permease [Gammaproteobacteria bacterium]
MPVELTLILCLVVIFVVPIFFDVNVGIVAFIVAFIAGTLALDLSAREVLAGFPSNMFLMLVGITLLLAIAHRNGTVDWIVGKLVALAGGRLVLLPWVLFVTALVTATMGPGAAPVLFVIGVGMVSRYGLNPLLVAAMIIHGTQAGAYSPVAPYGLVISELAGADGMVHSPVLLYAGVVAFHVVLAAVVFFLLGGRQLVGVSVEFAQGGAHVDTPSIEQEKLSAIQLLTLLGFASLVLGILLFQINIGFLAMTIALVLLLAGKREERSSAVNNVAWPIVLVICGVLTYVSLLQEAGATNWLAAQANTLGSPVLVGLILCFIVSIITGVASTIGTIGILVPLAAPFVLAGDLQATSLLTAMSVSAAVSDISPFSTWGAMFLATASQVLNRQEIFKAQLKYTLYMVTIMPIIAWSIFVLPGW